LARKEVQFAEPADYEYLTYQEMRVTR
jgi:hypothetical protein